MRKKASKARKEETKKVSEECFHDIEKVAEQWSPQAYEVMKKFPEKVKFGLKPDGLEITGKFMKWMPKEMGYYQGYVNNKGEMNGPGIVISKYGIFIQWYQADGRKQGSTTWFYSHGIVREGDFKDNEPIGILKITTLNGNVT